MEKTAYFAIGSAMFLFLGFWFYTVSKGKYGKGMLVTAGVVFICSILVLGWQVADRDSRKHTVIGRLVGVHFEDTKHDCVERFKIAIQDCPNGLGYCDHELPYTFQLSYPLGVCPSTSSEDNNDVVQVTFVAPESDDGTPEILQWLNLNWEVSFHSGLQCKPEAVPTK